MVVSCSSCRHLICDEEEIWHEDRNGNPIYFVKPIYAYSCGKLYTNLHNLNRRVCKLYMPISMRLDRYTKTNGEKNTMVNLNQIPQEKDRVDLAQLPQTALLIAVSEEMVQAQKGKTGGLLIRYKMLSDGDFKDMEFPQKYSAMSGSVLFEALNTLDISDTTELQTTVCEYRLTPMRTGFPRYIPFRAVKESNKKK